jgi:large subunit ribosomal protein L4e
MFNPDVTRLINSDEIQSVVRPAKSKISKRPWTQKKNPLVNKAILFRLNPYAKTLRRQELRECTFCRAIFTVANGVFHFPVKQERLKKKNAPKPRQPKAAGKQFLDNLFAL